jgi:Mrp family chromosome partitioning ATPase
MIVEKAVNMAGMMKKKVIGIVENLSYFVCPDCGSKHSVLGESHVAEAAERFGIGLTAKLPIDPAIAKACDAGRVEDLREEGIASLRTSSNAAFIKLR